MKEKEKGESKEAFLTNSRIVYIREGGTKIRDQWRKNKERSER